MFKLIIKKFLLIIIGILLSLLLLECGLRLAGWTISLYQQYKNNKALKNKSQYTIMCLGESTTAWQYPVQLQLLLNKKYPNKFSVVDCGIPGTNLQTILDSLDNNINKYKSNIAVCMMSINNNQIIYNPKNIPQNITKNEVKNYKLIYKLKIYKLFLLLKENLLVLFSIKPAFAEKLTDKIKSLENTLNKYHHLGDDFPEMETVALKLLNIDPYNETAFYHLARHYYLIKKDMKKAYDTSILAINKEIHHVELYNIALKYCIQNNIPITNLVNKLMEHPALLENFGIIEIYNTIEQYVDYETKNKILNSMNVNDDRIEAFKGIQQFTSKNYQQAEEYFKKAEQLRLQYPDTETYNLYKLVIKKLIDHNIKVICMQYPVRSILPLQIQLKNEPYYNKITFISNEKLFKDALMKKNFRDLFVDQFAGDFGHCTDLGNTLIAKNIVNTLEKILDLKEKN